ncbi:MAG: bacteriohemerythrin [Rhodospirillales bacterium]|nr:bacteriohemerythrin [Rhodospirillales bacterium]
MPLFTWTDDLSVGVPALDNDHRLLIDIINALDTARRNGAETDRLGGLLFSLINYTVIHFQREERLLERFGYAGFQQHHIEHQVLVEQLHESYRQLTAENGAAYASELLYFLKNWLTIHIMGSDMDYRDVLSGREILLEGIDRATIPVSGLDSGHSDDDEDLGPEWFQWSEALSVGVDAVDNDHRILINLIRDLNEATRQGQGGDVVGSVLGALVDYTSLHFQREEGLMRSLGYPESEQHAALHVMLVRQVDELRRLHAAGANLHIDREVLLFLKLWLRNHILGTDMKYKDFFTTHGAAMPDIGLDDIRTLVGDAADEEDDWNRLYTIAAAQEG